MFKHRVLIEKYSKDGKPPATRCKVHLEKDYFPVYGRCQAAGCTTIPFYSKICQKGGGPCFGCTGMVWPGV